MGTIPPLLVLIPDYHSPAMLTGPLRFWLLVNRLLINRWCLLNNGNLMWSPKNQVQNKDNDHHNSTYPHTTYYRNQINHLGAGFPL